MHQSEDFSKKKKKNLQKFQQKQILLKFTNINDHLIAVKDWFFNIYKFKFMNSSISYHYIHFNANSLNFKSKSAVKAEDIKV